MNIMLSVMVKMARFVWRVLDAIALSIYGLAVIDVLTIVSLEQFDLLDWLTGIDTLSKSVMIILGTLYFGLKGWDDHKMRKIKREGERIANLIKEKELEAKVLDNDEKKTPIYA